jgi:hypothetical protein
MWRLILLAFLSVPSAVWAQFEIKGRVTEERSEVPLAFVTIAVNDDRQGTYTDIDGKFTVRSAEPIRSLRFSYVGYKPLTFKPEGSDFLSVKMSRSVAELAEAVVVAGENPAHRIIREVIKRKKKNNPESDLPFIYESYNKFIFTGNVDTTLYWDEMSYNALDSVDKRTVDFFKKQHLMMMESVSERKFLPPSDSRETVLATRVSGLQSAEFALLATEFQSFSFYQEEINVGGSRYLSPVANGAIGKYFYHIEDTTYAGRDTVFIISYRPAKGRNFEGLEGVLYINTRDFALQNVIAEPYEKSKTMGIRIQQMYELIDDKKWFPVQLNTTIDFYGINLNRNHLVGIGRSYLKNIRLGADVERKEVKNIAVKMDPMATRRSDEFWLPHRGDSLSSKEAETYRVIDSLGRAENLDKKLKTMQALVTGRWPIGPLSLRIGQLMNFNQYEGYRLGLGAETNDRISEHVILGGYFAYGFRDKQWKYGGDLRIKLSELHAAWLEASYVSDVNETGGYMRHYDARLLRPDRYYQLYLVWMDRVDRVEAALRFRAFNHFRFKFFVNEQSRNAPETYFFHRPVAENINLGVNQFRYREAGVFVRLAYKEKFVETMGRRLSLGTPWPILYATITRGEHLALEGTGDFWRFEGRIEKDLRIKNVGMLRIRADGGYIGEDIPAIHLFNSRASLSNASFGIATPFAFETMRVNEFVSSRFAALHLRHSFGSLLFKREKFKPEIVIVHSAVIGTLDHPDSHTGFNLRAPEHGFFESGFELNRLLKSSISSLGIGVYYRHGAYSMPTVGENFAFKLSSSFAF